MKNRLAVTTRMNPSSPAVFSKPSISYGEWGVDGAQRNRIALRRFLNPVAELYPNFNSWLSSRFMQHTNEANRLILFAYDEKDIIVGASLLKMSRNENKICTFFISPKFKSRGIGDDLMKRSFMQFNDNDEVLITCSQSRKVELEPILNKSGFIHTHSVFDLYEKDASEFFYLRK